MCVKKTWRLIHAVVKMRQFLVSFSIRFNILSFWQSISVMQSLDSGLFLGHL